MKKLTDAEGEELILEILRGADSKLTTWEVDNEVRGKDSRCPDDTVRFLAKMRQKGMINGEVSYEKRGWVWWVES